MPEVCGITVLDTRGNIHFGVGAGVNPACRSQAEILGYRYALNGELVLPEESENRLCESCMSRLGITVERRG